MMPLSRLTGELEKGLSAEFSGDNKPEYGKQLLQKSVKGWNRSMVLVELKLGEFEPQDK